MTLTSFAAFERLVSLGNILLVMDGFDEMAEKSDRHAILEAFTQIHLLTRGGPVDATRTIVYGIYLDAFQNFQFGFASAESVVLFTLVLVLTIIQFRFVERRVHYQ